jgi:hypothetical protein
MIHQEFLYRLKLPPLEEVLLSSDILNPYVEKLSSGSKIFYPEPKDIFKPNWLRFKNVNWDYLSLFVRFVEQPFHNSATSFQQHLLL